MIIAIDGPAGAGKSTIAKKIAQKLGFLYIDTGAMYRALTFATLEKEISIKDTAKITALAKNTRIDLQQSQEYGLKVILNGSDVSQEIRKPSITRVVSDIAKIKEVRSIMVALQREFGARGDCVLDGRDIGTVVFPQAEKKFFLDANFKERVNRRLKELRELGNEISFGDVESDLQNRDTIDSTREVAPLKKAEDAVYIDTTAMSIEEVVETLLREIQRSTR